MNEHESRAWTLLLKVKEVLDDIDSKYPCSLIQNHENAQLDVAPGVKDHADLVLTEPGLCKVDKSLPKKVQSILGLYLTMFNQNHWPHHVVGHLGQSLDAQIATRTGDAFFVTGEQNRKHLHRLRALSHAVIVGAGTVHLDNPQLTTRAVSGENPVRVVIDPQARLQRGYGVFCDEKAPTLLVHQSSVDLAALKESDRAHAVSEQVVRLIVPSSDHGFNSADVVTLLAARKLTRLFVEGGGITVSRFFEDNCLHQLQVAVAPLLVGAGKPSIQLPGVEKMRDSFRAPHRLYRMGEDVLWDFHLSGFAHESIEDQLDCHERLDFERLM